MISSKLRTLNHVNQQSRIFSRILSNMAKSSPIFKSGTNALITGGASGVGLALAKKCAGYGMTVIIAGEW